MNYFVPAQIAAQLLSLLVFGTMARWYVAPRLAVLPRADALIPLLWIHVFRYIALQAFSAQRDGFPVSDGHLLHIVIGDLLGAGIALVTIFALRFRLRAGIILTWVLVVTTIYDTVTNIQGGAQEQLLGKASGVTWLVLGIYVPLLLVSVIMLVWQLYTRRGEALDSAGTPAAPRRAAVLRTS